MHRAVVPPARRGRSPRWLWLGAAGPGLFTAVFVVEDLARPAVNPWQQSISFLSHGPWGWVQNLDFIGSGLLVLTFAGILAASAMPATRRQDQALARWQALGGMGMVAMGLVRQHRMRAGGLATPFGYLTAMGIAHIAAAVAVLAAALGSCLLEATSPAAPAAWRIVSALAALLLLASVAAFAVAVLQGGPSGLWERAAALTAALWMAAEVRRLTARGEGRPPDHQEVAPPA